MKVTIIGMGDMGRIYAKKFSEAGYEVFAIGRPEKEEQLKEEYKDTKITITKEKEELTKNCDYIIFCVETENIDEVVKNYAPYIKQGTIVGGQTSVKTPEIEAFEKYLDKDIEIVTCHSLHGPSVDTKDQNLAVIKHKASDESYKKALNILNTLDSKVIELKDYKEHDKITADTQVSTQIGFQSMGTAWKRTGVYPWENGFYTSGIDNVKILLTLRIFAGKAHVYAGLALLNPFAREQIVQYAVSTSELFKMMIQEDETTFRNRILEAGKSIFGNENQEQITLDPEVMKEFNLETTPEERKPNSHLSILAMVDTWHQMNIDPYKNLICKTPLFKLRLGIAEYLFKNKELLEESMKTAIYDKNIRSDDLEFHTAVRQWASSIYYKDLKRYKEHFEDTKDFFKDKIEIAKEKSNELIKKLNN